MDMLEQNPFLYRSMQGIVYLKSNPLLMMEKYKLYTSQQMFQLIYDYVMYIFNTIFKDLGMYYLKEEMCVDDESMNFSLFAPLTESEFGSNFSSFMSHLDEIIRNFVKDSNLHVVLISCDGQGLRFYLNIGKSNWEENGHIYEKPNDAIMI